MKIARLGVLLLVFAAAGCVELKQPAPELRSYRLDYPAPALGAPPLPVVLRVPTFTVDGIYDREPIVYREDAYATGVYHYHQWSSPPGIMVSDLLARDLAASGTYRAVVSGASALAPDYLMDGYVETIEERGTGKDCNAVLHLRISLLRLRRGEGDPVVLRGNYAADTPTACNDPHALAAAMSNALERVSTQLQTEMHAAITRDLNAQSRHAGL